MDLDVSTEMIKGVGIDLVDVTRFAGKLKSSRGRLAARLFSVEERKYCASFKASDAHLAARFAAKEAVLKALGTGLRDGIKWTDISVSISPKGAPSVSLKGQALKALKKLGARKVLISMSHDAGLAAAIAVAE